MRTVRIAGLTIGLLLALAWQGVHAELYCLNTGDSAPFTWYVGEPVSDFDVTDLDSLSCYANGKELQYIENKFVNLPGVRNTKGVLWRGENARFVLDNLGD